MRDDDLPKSFIYTGRIIFISNLPESKIDQAIRSRSAVIDVSMTTDEVVDRMGVMIEEDEFLPEFEKNIKVDALEFIAKMKNKMREINLRTLITVCKVRAADEDGTLAEMAEYLVCK
jgi:DNA polymerase III delta prime subunit